MGNLFRLLLDEENILYSYSLTTSLRMQWRIVVGNVCHSLSVAAGMIRMLHFLVLRVSIVVLSLQPLEMFKHFHSNNHNHVLNLVQHRTQLLVCHRFKGMNKKLGTDKMVWDPKRLGILLRKLMQIGMLY